MRELDEIAHGRNFSFETQPLRRIDLIFKMPKTPTAVDSPRHASIRKHMQENFAVDELMLLSAGTTADVCMVTLGTWEHQVNRNSTIPETGSAYTRRLKLDIATRMLHAVKGHVNGYIPIGGGVYSSGFYTLLGRYAVLQDAAYARTFVKDQDEKLENMHDKLRAKWADNALGDAYDITQCVEFTDLVEQTLLDSYVYIAVLTDEERLLFCLNVLVNFEDGIPIQNDKESIDLYHAWLCTDRLKLPPCTMPLLKERRD